MSKTNFLVTRDQVLQHVRYDPESGSLTYVTGGHKRKAGDPVPAAQNVVNILGSSYSKLKLIWLIQAGKWPDGKVNYKDFGCGDLRWEALASGVGPKGVELTQARLMEVLSYDHESGVFTWKISPGSSAKKGDEAGSANAAGYTLIRVDGTLYLAHRLAFLFMSGEMPPDLVDHINCDKGDNRWINLRHATQSENQQNRKKAQSNNKSSGLLGVYWSQQNEAWAAKAVVDGIQYHAGTHQTPEEAHQAYLTKKAVVHPYGTLSASC